MLAPFFFMDSAFNFSNQGDLIIAYSLAAQAHLQSVYLHQASCGLDHISLSKPIFVYLCIYVSSACNILYFLEQLLIVHLCYINLQLVFLLFHFLVEY